MKREIIRTILSHTPYTPESEKYKSMMKDMEQLSIDTLTIIKLSLQGK